MREDVALDFLLTLESLLAAEQTRGLYPTHPRLAILGALEARLLSFDLLVLGGMTEGSWPADPDKSPFLPESLRTKIGLKPLEHKIGLSALDFVNFASEPKRVIVTHAVRHHGRPQQPSRFVQRLQACNPCRDLAREKELRAWLAQLQRGEKKTKGETSATAFSERPQPTAAQAARPLRLSLTKLSDLHEDPYSIYARQVLRLVPLDPLVATSEAQLYGSCLHTCFEEILRRFAHDRKQLATEALKDIVTRQVARFAPSSFAEAFWQEQLERSAARMLVRVKALNPRNLWCEVTGEHALALGQAQAQGGERSLTLSARADLVVETEDGEWWLIDHKTGEPPSRKILSNLEQPQLVLGAWLLQRGAFRAEGKTLQPVSLPQACYWRFPAKRSGIATHKIDEQVWAKKANEQGQIFESAQAFADACFQHYATLLRRFDHEDTPYRAHALSPSRARYDPYRHLARRQAWSFDDE